MNNLEEYVSLVVDATIRSGISRQVEAFKLGFNQVSATIYFLSTVFSLHVLKAGSFKYRLVESLCIRLS